MSNGQPDNHLACNHDDPTCDAVAGDNACTFTFRMCFNMFGEEKRFFCNARGAVTGVEIKSPVEGNPKTRIDGENISAIEAALTKLGGGVGGYWRRSMVFYSPMAETVCTDPIPFKVALGQKAGAPIGRKVRLTYRVQSVGGRFDRDTMFFRCNP